MDNHMRYLIEAAIDTAIQAMYLHTNEEISAR